MFEKSEPITARRYHSTVSRFIFVLQATLSSLALEQWMNDQPAQMLLKFQRPYASSPTRQKKRQDFPERPQLASSALIHGPIK